MNAKILILDDEASARQVIENFLFSEDYALQFAASGLEGLELARSWQPDVILCDVMMPVMNGFEFCRQIRADASLGQVPIILITALNDHQSKLTGLQAGADEFISKPVEAYELRARLRTLTRLDRFRRLNDEHLKLEAAYRELIRAHEELQASETRFRSLVETSSDAIFIVDRETNRFVLANPAATRLYGYSLDEFLQMNSTEISGEPQKTMQAIRDAAPYIPERLHRRKDGSTFPVEIIGGYFEDAGRSLHTAFIRDISERKQAEEKQREAELRYRALFNQSHDAIFILDFDGVHLDVNQRAAEMLGYSIEEMRGLSVRELSTELRQSLNNLDRLLKGEHIPVYERNFRKKNGETLPVEINAELVRDLHGNPIHIQSVVRDISERKQAETKLRESEERFRSFIEQSSDGFMLVDEQGRIIEWNSAMTSITSLKRENILGIYAWDFQLQLAAPEAKARLKPEELKEILIGMLQSGRSPMFGHVIEIEIQTTTGKSKFIQQTSFSIHTAQGHRIGAVMRDITEQKAIQEKLQENEEKYHSIISHAVEAITLADELGVIIEWNKAAEELTGVPASEALGRYTWDLYTSLLPPEKRTPDHIEEVAQKVEEVLLTGKGSLLDFFAFEMIHPNGKRYFVNQTIFTISTRHGFRICTITHDVTAAKEAQLALQAAHDELEQKVRARTAELNASNLALQKALRTKDEFLAAMSHELRTPLSGMLGMTELLQMPYYGLLNAKQLKAITTIEASGKRLLETVNNVLEFTLLQSGSVSGDSRPCSIDALCQTGLERIHPLARAKGQHTHFSAVPEHITVQTDEQHLLKLLMLLLNNASKFTPPGGEFGIEITGDGEAGWVKVAVWDQGIGIKEQDLPRLFEPFVQIDASLARQYEGSGLGLALAKQLAQTIGGRIEVISSFGKGSRFIITLPVK